MVRRSYFGSENPDFRNAGHKICGHCGCQYFSYIKSRQYCSRSCYTHLRKKKAQMGQLKLRFGHAKVKRKCPFCTEIIESSHLGVKTCGSRSCRDLYFIKKLGPKPITICANCGKSFIHHRSSDRQYCSYACHIADGGAQHAGRCSALAMRKYGAKKDANHSDIVAALEKMSVQVIDTSDHGGGFPDLICCVRKQTLLVEIKNRDTAYGRRGLNKLQLKFAENWRGGAVYIVANLEDAQHLANGRLDRLVSYGGFDVIKAVG